MNKKSSLLFSISLFCCFFDFSLSANSTLNINIICCNNGVGLTRDFTILKEELDHLGHFVSVLNFNPHENKIPPKIKQADINIFIEHSQESLLPYAKKNYFIPNPEWSTTDSTTIQAYDLILCRTKEVQRIFTPINPNTFYLGFTSIDRYKKTIPKNYSKLFHLRGKSFSKGTHAVLAAWKRRPDFPLITILAIGGEDPSIDNIDLLGNFISEKKLIKLQNECGIHLCPSETEGFGHYIGEAMSAEAVVITTDAPPMNEFISDKRCLVKYRSTSTQQLATTYLIDPADLEHVMNNLLTLSEAEFRTIGSNNRKAYLKQKEAFRERLKALFGNL